MINSGFRWVKYRAGLNHTCDDDRIGHCQSRLAFRMPQSCAFVVGQKNTFDHGPVSIETSVQQCCCSRDTRPQIQTWCSPR